MVTHVLRSGVSIDAPSGVALEAAPNAGPVQARGVQRPPPGPVPIAPPPDDDLVAGLLAGLRRQFELVDQALLTPSPALRASQARVLIDVPLASADENAVALCERDGILTWIPATELHGTSALRGAGGQRARIEIDLAPSAGPAFTPARRGALPAGLAPVRMWLFRFVARYAVRRAVDFLDGRVLPGLRVLHAADPDTWHPHKRIAAAMPAERPARVLLFIHGTFSSTVGGFGALAATPPGRDFLRACMAHYDVVLGYDHPTLSRRPEQNASRLLQLLRMQAWGPHAPVIDLVAHSRGGLVARCLIEQALPAHDWPATVRRAVLVGATAAGTELARPENWRALADLYTNLAVTAGRAIALVPGMTTAGMILSEAIATVGGLVKQIASDGLDEDRVPGLAAMQPGSALLTRLGELDHEGTASPYCAITSSFAARLDGDHEPREMPLRLVQLLTDSVVGRLMRGVDNDLVVPTASMAALGRLGTADTLDLGRTPRVYHTNYFVQPQVVQALGRWLLPAPDGPEFHFDDLSRELAALKAQLSAREDEARYLERDAEKIVRNAQMPAPAAKPGPSRPRRPARPAPAAPAPMPRPQSDAALLRASIPPSHAAPTPRPTLFGLRAIGGLLARAFTSGRPRTDGGGWAVGSGNTGGEVVHMVAGDVRYGQVVFHDNRGLRLAPGRRRHA